MESDNVAETIEVLKAMLANKGQDAGASEKDRVAMLEKALTTLIAQPSLLSAIQDGEGVTESEMDVEWQKNLQEMEKRQAMLETQLKEQR